MQNLGHVWLCACTFSVVPVQSIYPNIAAIKDFHNGDTVAVSFMSSFTTPLQCPANDLTYAVHFPLPVPPTIS